MACMRIILLSLLLASFAPTVSFKLNASSNSFVPLPYILSELIWVVNGDVLSGINKITGKVEKKIKMESDIVYFKQISKDKVLIGLSNAQVFVFNLDNSTEALQELGILPKPIHAGLLDGDVFYALSNDNCIYCVKDKKVVWHIDGVARQRFFKSDLFVSGNYLLAVIKPDTLSIFNKLSGLQVYEYVFGSNVFTQFIQVGDEIHCASETGMLILDAKTLFKKAFVKFDFNGCVEVNDKLVNNKLYLYNKKGIYYFKTDKFEALWKTDESTSEIISVKHLSNSLFIECVEKTFVYDLNTKTIKEINKNRMPICGYSHENADQNSQTKIEMIKAGRARVQLLINNK